MVKWPFFLGDALLLGVAATIVALRGGALNEWQAAACAAAVGLGAWLAVWPFVLEYRATLTLLETDSLAGTLEQISQVEGVARQIQNATGQWQTVHEHAVSIAGTAKKLADNMAGEAKAFAEFMQKAADSERSHLRLEVEKLKRNEGEWLQVVARTLDNTFALHQAALRSGQPRLIDQLSAFLNISRDFARRVGVVLIVPSAEDRYDARLHDLEPGGGEVPAEAVVDRVVAPGLSFQGQLLRKPVVALREKRTESLDTEVIARPRTDHLMPGAAPGTAEPGEGGSTAADSATADLENPA